MFAPFAVAKYTSYGQRGVVIENARGHSAEVLQDAHVAFEKCFRRLGRKGAHEAIVGVRQIEGHEMRLALHAGNGYTHQDHT